jgi:mono/diheme cytochrome c family protein
MKGFLRPLLIMLVSASAFSTYTLAEGGDHIYKSKCAPCHGPSGAGDTKLGQSMKIRDMRSAEVQKQSDDELEAIITKGKGKMPAYGGKLKEEQIDELVKFIRTLKK